MQHLLWTIQHRTRRLRNAQHKHEPTNNSKQQRKIYGGRKMSVNLEKLNENEMLKTMVDVGLITDQGILVSGIGILVEKLDQISQND